MVGGEGGKAADSASCRPGAAGHGLTARTFFFIRLFVLERAHGMDTPRIGWTILGWMASLVCECGGTRDGLGQRWLYIEGPSPGVSVVDIESAGASWSARQTARVADNSLGRLEMRWHGMGLCGYWMSHDRGHRIEYKPVNIYLKKLVESVVFVVWVFVCFLPQPHLQL